MLSRSIPYRRSFMKKLLLLTLALLLILSAACA